LQAHHEEVFCLFEELAGKDYDRFRSVVKLGEDVMLASDEGGREEEETYLSLLRL
jgi:hypothetical protein